MTTPQDWDWGDETQRKGTSSQEESEDEERGQWVDRGDHPLLNEVVLTTLFKYVKPSDLKACRLLCKKWNVLSLPSARSTFEVIIVGDEPVGIGIRNLDTNIHRLSNFVELFRSNFLGLPFTKFMLGSFNPTIGDGEAFFQLCGGMIMRIDLSGTQEVHSVEDMGELLRLVPNLKYFKMPREIKSTKGAGAKLFSDAGIPTLKSLSTLDMGQIEAKSRKYVCPTFFVEFFSAAENISSVLTSETLPEDGTGLELLKILVQMRRESQIEILSLPSIDREQKIAMKEISGLKLKHLRVKFGQSLRILMTVHTHVLRAWGEQDWMELVELMRDSLISLQVHHNRLIPTRFPRMSKLKLLDFVTYPISGSVDSPFKNFHHSFPVLQYLKLNSTSDISEDGILLNRFEGFLAGSESCPMMSSLCLGNSIVNLQTFDRVLNIFPNLKELELKITEDGADILEGIWTQMGGLEKLNIYGRLSDGNPIESLITGISCEEMRKITQFKLDTLVDMTIEMRRQAITQLIEEHSALPSIRNLTNLRHLSMNMGIESECHEVQDLSDWTGYLGFYSMRNLRHLNISVSLFSEACSHILVADMELDSWSFTLPCDTHIIPSRWNLDNDESEWSFPSSKFSK